MYSLKYLWQQEPAALAEGVRAVILAAVALGLIQMDQQALGAVLLALSTILTLLVRHQVTPTAKA